ncbi:MAG TPA: NfeD family protein [Clostridia bacterium]|nr:NfeD family protein [Clostridia bacterium]
MGNPWTWLVLAIVFGTVELCNFDLTMCWFLVGALLAFLAALCGIPWYIQIAIFLIATILSLIFLRPLAKDLFKIGAVQTNAPALIGKTAIVQEKITPLRPGAINVYGQIWGAKSLAHEEIDVNEEVQIVEIEGVFLKVQKLLGSNHEGAE